MECRRFLAGDHYQAGRRGRTVAVWEPDQGKSLEGRGDLEEPEMIWELGRGVHQGS